MVSSKPRILNPSFQLTPFLPSQDPAGVAVCRNRFVFICEFTFEGNDECEPTSGSGWVMLKEMDIIKGEFRFQNGDMMNMCKVLYFESKEKEKYNSKVYLLRQNPAGVTSC